MKHLSEDFWNIRGDFKIAHMLNIGTHMSVVRRQGGTFVLLDSYEPAKQDLDALMALTDGGSLIQAVLNVHPFHTVHCDFIQKLAPHARLIGTHRHHQQKPDLQWDPALIEDPATQKEFADLFDFSIPSGVDFISADEDIHVSSVLVRHRASRIIHVDDTLMYIDLPSLLGKMVPGPQLRFHPKLADALETRPSAADDYIRWANGLASDWADTTMICAAHNGILDISKQGFAEAIRKALDADAPTFEKHRKTYG